jgi:hypothetical protein
VSDKKKSVAHQYTIRAFTQCEDIRPGNTELYLSNACSTTQIESFLSKFLNSGKELADNGKMEESSHGGGLPVAERNPTKTKAP